jgi:hypothetical protein
MRKAVLVAAAVAALLSLAAPANRAAAMTVASPTALGVAAADLNSVQQVHWRWHHRYWGWHHRYWGWHRPYYWAGHRHYWWGWGWHRRWVAYPWWQGPSWGPYWSSGWAYHWWW